MMRTKVQLLSSLSCAIGSVFLDAVTYVAIPSLFHTHCTQSLTHSCTHSHTPASMLSRKLLLRQAPSVYVNTSDGCSMWSDTLLAPLLSSHWSPSLTPASQLLTTTPLLDMKINQQERHVNSKSLYSYHLKLIATTVQQQLCEASDLYVSENLTSATTFMSS